MRTRTLATALPAAVLAAALATAAPALGADADWLDPAKEGITSLTTTLMDVAVPLIALAIVAFGAWSAMVGRVEWAKLWIYVIAGIIVGVGPRAVVWLMGLIGTGS